MKRAINVPTRCHTTDLFSALRKTSCADYMRSGWQLINSLTNCLKLALIHICQMTSQAK